MFSKKQRLGSDYIIDANIKLKKLNKSEDLLKTGFDDVQYYFSIDRKVGEDMVIEMRPRDEGITAIGQLFQFQEATFNATAFKNKYLRVRMADLDKFLNQGVLIKDYLVFNAINKEQAHSLEVTVPKTPDIYQPLSLFDQVSKVVKANINRQIIATSLPEEVIERMYKEDTETLATMLEMRQFGAD